MPDSSTSGLGGRAAFRGCYSLSAGRVQPQAVDGAAVGAWCGAVCAGEGAEVGCAV